VSEQGATAFDAEGRVVAVLAPGAVVVEGTIEAGGSMAHQYHRLHSPRRATYDDKVVRPVRGPRS
jgi:hypothetical protein